MYPFDFIKLVLFVCFKHNGSVTSWGRTPKHNKDVGGVEGSIHMIWLGCDVVLDVMKKNLDFEKDCNILGLVAIFEGDHYHLQPSKF